MALCEKAIALELEVATSQSFPSRKQLVALESQLEDVYMDLQPTPQDYQARKVAVDFVNGLARDKLSVGDVRKHYGLCNVRAFGSFTMDMFTSTSDLDISLNVQFGLETLTREERVKLLRKLTKLLFGLQSKGFVRQIQPVLKAKVPVVKFLHCSTGIECDVSIENKDGIMKSEFLRIFSSLDSRFRKLCFLFKAWANAHGINSSKDHTLNSLSIILLVAFHLQTRVPAILPPFSMLLKGVNTSTASHAVSFVEHEANIFKDFGKKNSESVVQLFNSFLTKMMAVKHLWHEGLCASAYEGTWTSTTDPSWIFVEDFTSLSQNAARSVNAIGFDAIYECCDHAFIQLKSYFLGKHEAQLLKSSLFNMHTTSAVHKRKRNMEDHPESGNHQPMQGSMIQQSVTEDRKILLCAPSSRSYDSRFGQMIPGETIFRANVLERGEHQPMQGSLIQQSVTEYRKRNMEDHPESGNYQPMQGSMIHPSVSEDRKILLCAPYSRSYDSRFGQMMPGETIFRANVLERGEHQPMQGSSVQQSVTEYRKRNMEDHPESGNHQPMQGSMIQQSVTEDRKILCAPSSRLYDSTFRQMMPGERILRANLMESGNLAQVTQPTIDSYLVPSVNSGLLREHPTKRLKLQHPILGDRYSFPRTDEQPVPDKLSMLLYQGYPGRLSRDDQFYHSNIRRRLQSAGQQSYLLPEPRIGMHEQRRVLEERAAETYPGAHGVLPPPFTNHGVPLYTEVPRGLNQSRYSNEVRLHGYGY